MSALSSAARRYGAQPWHLAVLLALFAVTGYTATRLLGDLPVALRILVWFVGAALVWDLVLGPLLALADRVLRAVLPRSALNHVRVPALFSALLLVLFAPLVLQRSEPVYQAKAGLTQDPYLDRWLAVTGVLFAVSAVLYAVRRVAARR